MTKDIGLVAGIGRVDITPEDNFPLGMWVAQREVLAKSIHRRILITALYLGTGSDSVILVTLDLSVLSAELVYSIKQEVSKATELAIDRVWLFVSHTHAGPVSYEEYDDEKAKEVAGYLDALAKHSADAAKIAIGSIRPVKVAAGVGISNIGVNRDLRLANGDFVIGPNEDGAADRDVSVLRLDNLDDSAYGCVFIYGCHPTVLGPANTALSPDFPGVARDTVEALTGATTLFLQGAGGNVGPREPFTDSIAKVEEVGKALGCEAAKVFLEMGTPKFIDIDRVLESGARLAIMKEVSRFTYGKDFRVISRPASLPIGNPGANVITDAPTILQNAELELARARTCQTNDLENMQHLRQIVARSRFLNNRATRYLTDEQYAVSLGGFAFDSIVFICCGMEPYAEIAQTIKKHSPFETTLFAAYEGPDLTYLAPREYYVDAPPIQVKYSPFAPSSAGKFVENVDMLLNDLYDGMPPSNSSEV